MKLERRVHLIYRKGATLSHAAKAFLRVAREADRHKQSLKVTRRDQVAAAASVPSAV